jgi:hypothetical protein
MCGYRDHTRIWSALRIPAIRPLRRAGVLAITCSVAHSERSRRRDVLRLSVALTVLAVLTIGAMLAPAWVR